MYSILILIDLKNIIFNFKLLITFYFIFLVVLVVCWTPYCLISMYSAFFSYAGQNFSPYASTVSSMFAKSSMLWPSIILLISNERNYLNEMLKGSFLNSSTRSIRTWMIVYIIFDLWFNWFSYKIWQKLFLLIWEIVN